MPRKTLFPNKEPGSFSFRFSLDGVDILKKLSILEKLSQGDIAELSIREHLQGIVSFDYSKKLSKLSGGHRCFYQEKTTKKFPVSFPMTFEAKEHLKKVSEAIKVSQNDLIEYAIREKFKKYQ